MRLWSLESLVGLLRSVHPDAAVRAAAEAAEQEAARFDHELGLNRALYEAVKACPAGDLDAGARRFRDRLLRDFHRAGVDRDEATRERVRLLQEELVALGQTFTRNILSDVREVVLDGREELQGLPPDYIRSHAPDPEGKVRISTDYPDYNPFMSYAVSARRRQELYTVFRRRAHPQNLEVLKQLLVKRHELAVLLGYRSWAAYATEDKMIRDPGAVRDFISRVSDIAEERAGREYDLLLRRKRQEDPLAADVHDWEKSYYEELVRRQSYRLDSQEVRSYFEYERVKRGLLALTEDLFGVRFVPAAGAPRWHEDVEVLDVHENGVLAGRIYLDMHPRDGKFKHAAMIPLVRGVKGESVPEAALVCNFPDPRRTRPGPALLEHDDVVTFFHEFGHLLHMLLARDQEWVIFSGTATEWDFIEVPSQLFEEWAWDYEVLKRFAVHHPTGETIPPELVERLRAARDFGRGLWVRHQMFYAAVSLAYYDREPVGFDTSALLAELQNQYSPFRFVEGTYFQASFGHLDDYSALYYTYMWSLVIAKDIFGAFHRHGALSREAARRYRQCILEPGGSKDAAELVRDFLARDYTFAAFQEWLVGGPRS
jgi:thimet oligopeptidase